MLLFVLFLSYFNLPEDSEVRPLDFFLHYQALHWRLAVATRLTA